MLASLRRRPRVPDPPDLRVSHEHDRDPHDFAHMCQQVQVYDEPQSSII